MFPRPITFGGTRRRQFNKIRNSLDEHRRRRFRRNEHFRFVREPRRSLTYIRTFIFLVSLFRERKLA